MYKNVTGADYFKVAARLAGTGVPTPVDSPDTDSPDANSLAGAIIAFPLAPRDLGGTLFISQDVANLTADENNPTTFSLQVNNPSGLPLQYQWFRDGSPISGATLATYTIQPTIAADNGATFSVQVAKVGSSVTSRSACPWCGSRSAMASRGRWVPASSSPRNTWAKHHDPGSQSVRAR